LCSFFSILQNLNFKKIILVNIIIKLNWKIKYNLSIKKWQKYFGILLQIIWNKITIKKTIKLFALRNRQNKWINHIIKKINIKKYMEKFKIKSKLLQSIY